MPSLVPQDNIMIDDRVHARQNKVRAKQRLTLMWEQWLEPQERLQKESHP